MRIYRIPFPWTNDENRAVRQLIGSHGTPLFLISPRRVAQNTHDALHEIRTLPISEVRLFYSLKAYPSARIARCISRLDPGVGICVASAREFMLARELRLPPSRLTLHSSLLDGPILHAISSGDIGIVSISSLYQAQQVAHVARVGRQPMLLGRLRCVSLPRSKFGMSLRELRETSEFARAKGLHLAGAHVHLGQELYSRATVSHVKQLLTSCIRYLNRNHQKLIVNLGGGWHSKIHESWTHINGFNAIRDIITSLVRNTHKERLNISIMLELGRRLVGDASLAVGRVIESKKMESGVVHLTDLGIGTIPALKSAVYGMSVLRHGTRVERLRGVVAGPACTDSDRYEGAIVDAAPGDLIVFSNVGAYTLALASGFGGSLPNVVTISNSGSHS